MFRSSWLHAALTTFLLAASGPTASAESAATAVRFEPSAIIDHAGLDRPMAAITLFIPQGWQTAGGVVWGEQYRCTNGYALRWQALAPDGMSGALLLPQQGWEFNSNNAPVVNINCNRVEIHDVETYLRLLLQDVQPDAEDIVFSARPDLLAEFPQTHKETPWAMGVQQSWLEAGELVFGFNEKGVAMEGHLAAVVNFEKTITSTTEYHAKAVRAQALPAYGSFAPRGQYNPALFRAMRLSLIPDTEWSQEIARHNHAMSRATLQEIAERGKFAARDNRDISAIIEESWQQQQISSDRRAYEFIKSIRETESDSDSAAPGGQVEFDAHFRHAWKLEDGSYVLSEESGFDPLQAFGLSGTPLQLEQ